MAEVWSGEVPDRCRSCNRKLNDVFYDAKMIVCEGFMQMQVCERCFENGRMLGRAERE